MRENDDSNEYHQGSSEEYDAYYMQHIAKVTKTTAEIMKIIVKIIKLT